MKQTPTEQGQASITLAMVKSGSPLAEPIYQHKPYVVLSRENVVLSAGTLEEIKALGVYFDDCAVEVRQHDLHLNDNTKIKRQATAKDFLPLFQCSELTDQVCSKPEYDKARTAGNDDETACGESLIFDGVQPDLAALIVRAVNLHEAYGELERIMNKVKNWDDYLLAHADSGETERELRYEVEHEMQSALATLAKMKEAQS